MNIKTRLDKLEKMQPAKLDRPLPLCFFYGETPTEEDYIEAEDIQGSGLDEFYNAMERRRLREASKHNL